MINKFPSKKECYIIRVHTITQYIILLINKIIEMNEKSNIRTEISIKETYFLDC